eukprot:1821026-Rhodomonas_salina.4
MIPQTAEMLPFMAVVLTFLADWAGWVAARVTCKLRQPANLALAGTSRTVTDKGRQHGDGERGCPGAVRGTGAEQVLMWTWREVLRAGVWYIA